MADFGRGQVRFQSLITKWPTTDNVYCVLQSQIDLMKNIVFKNFATKCIFLLTAWHLLINVIN